MPLAFEVEHRVDQMLEHPGPCERAFLRHVADQKRRDAPRLGEHHQSRAALTHLGDTARRGFELWQVDRLDRVDHERPGLELIELGLDQRQVRLGDQVHAVRRDAETVGAELDLRRRLFARDVQHRRRRGGERL